MVVAGLGREETVGEKAASSKAKVARALEVKSEGGKQSPDNQASNQSAGWQNPAAKAVAMPAAKAAAMPVDKAVATEATAADKPAAEAAVEETAMAAASEDEESAVVKASDVDVAADVGD
ncbi:hypothetical protein PF004_g30699 [Phytophthora fragariae]|nr:hypothetical protein PF004_g30699 [Phytophthora fragariae]